MGAVVARKAIPWTFLLILTLAAFLAGFMWLWLDARDKNAAAGATIGQHIRTGEAAIAETQYLGEALTESREVVVRVEQARAESQILYREAVAHDPSAAAFDRTPVPDSLREVARQRAAARLGSGGAADGTGGATPAPGEGDGGP